MKITNTTTSHKILSYKATRYTDSLFEIALEELENKKKIRISITNNPNKLKCSLHNSFTSEELNIINPIWTNHDIEDKFRLISNFFFQQTSETTIDANKREYEFVLKENVMDFIDITSKSITIIFTTGIIKNNIVLKLHEKVVESPLTDKAIIKDSYISIFDVIFNYKIRLIYLLLLSICILIIIVGIREVNIY